MISSLRCFRIDSDVEREQGLYIRLHWQIRQAREDKINVLSAWLERAISLDMISKLSKPVRYVSK
jgi:hypothetical protein